MKNLHTASIRLIGFGVVLLLALIVSTGAVFAAKPDNTPGGGPPTDMCPDIPGPQEDASECPEEPEDPPVPPQENQVTICHEGDEGPETLSVNESALQSHLNHGDTEGSCQQEEDVDETAPSAPSHVSPANGATLTTAELTEMQWTDVSDPSEPVVYFYESATNPATNGDGSFANPVYQSGQLASSQIPANGTPEGTYYWHVRAQDNEDNSSAWTSPWSVTVSNTPTDDEDDEDEEDPQYPYGNIISPTPNEVLSGIIALVAEYFDGDDENDDAVQWALRAGTCAAGTGTVAGNVDGFNDSFTWDGSQFNASVDASAFTPGDHCFIFNPTDDGQINVRETVTFSIIAPSDDDEEEDIFGCTNPEASNFNELATIDDESCEFEDDENEEESNETTTEEAESTSNRAGATRRGGRVAGAFTGDGEVLGVSTGVCEMYLTDYMKEGDANNPAQVTKLQTFLTAQGFTVPATGFFGPLTTEAVKQFQAAHAADILQPWITAGLATSIEPTGNVYKTTRYKINNIMCEGSEPMPVLP